uniref:BHLH domain-containing protein n=1 Tax=Mesocestoides corti TaxID=53468 RepID=A0A5K3F805_MESCO
MTQKQEPVPMRPYCGSHPRQCIDQNPLRGRMRIRNGTDDSSRLRKITKPLMEKKRRERINMALEALKRFVAEPILKEGAQKLEKADILDLTVKYVYSCARRNSTAAATWPSQAPWLSFLAGYAACEANLHSLLVAAAGASRPQAGLSPREMSLLVALDGRKNAAATSFLAALAAPSTSQTTPPAAHLQSEGEPTHPPQPPRVWRPW